MVMKVLSWNIAGGHTITGAVEESLNYNTEDLPYFEQQIKQLNPDVVGLQEVHTPDKDDTQTQAGILAKAVGYKYFENQPYGKSHIKDGNKISLAMLSKYPIINSFFHQLPNPNLTIKRPNGDKWVTFDVGFLVNTIRYKEQKIVIMNCHLVPFHYFERNYDESEFQYIRDDIAELLSPFSETPTIVLGDFNYADLRKIIPDVFENQKYKEAFEHVETTPEKGQQDHILFTKHWNLKKYEIRKGKSDHHMCIADFNFSS
jgi:endonuclease/exonuclease/phosphatase family metal-dependent hydrolase